jgi:hypothetical protein
MYHILNILQSDMDVNMCLISCSNEGICRFNSLRQKYYCECNQNFMGKSCQTDKRPGFQSNKCLNNATCLSLNTTSFECKCPSNGLYYGEYCKNKINSCENVTCSNHGFCFLNQTQTKCECFTGYSGDKCDFESCLVKVIRYVQWTSTIICIICLITIWTLIVGNDVLNYFKIGNDSSLFLVILVSEKHFCLKIKYLSLLAVKNFLAV